MSCKAPGCDAFIFDKSFCRRHYMKVYGAGKKIPATGKGSSLYSRWLNMRRRCRSAGAKDAEYYYGKGIKVCDEWNKFENFRTWALDNGYREELTIDRVDSDKDYCPDNCQWITQGENTRRSHLDTGRRYWYNGSALTVREIAELEGWDYTNAHRSIKRHGLVAVK